MEEGFYRSGMKCRDWPAVVSDYEDLIRRARTASEFSDIANRLIGELAISHKVAVPWGFYYQEILETHYPELHVVPEKDTLSCLMAVSAGKVDAALAEKPVFDFLINRHFLVDLKSLPLVEGSHFDNTPVSIGVRRDSEILRNILKKAMDRVSQEELSRLNRRWPYQDGSLAGRPQIDRVVFYCLARAMNEWFLGVNFACGEPAGKCKLYF